MANVKFTEFPSATTLTGTEIIPIVQAGTNKKVTATLLKAFADSGYVPYVGATTDLNLDSHDLYTAKVWLKDVPNAGFGSMELTDGVLHFEDVDGHNMFSMEDGYFAVNNGPTIRALFNVSALTANRDFALPNATGTLALTSQIPSVSGTTNYLPKFTGASALGNSLIYDSGTAIGIGTASPNGKLDVLGTKTTALATADDFLTMGLLVDDATTGYAIGVGGGIVFRGKRNSLGTQTIYGAIDGIKTNAGEDDYVGAIRFFTNQNSTGVPLERVRIAGTGNLLLNTTTDAGYKLDVNGTARVSGAATFSSSVTTGAGSTSTAGLIVKGGSSIGTPALASGQILVGATSTYRLSMAYDDNLGYAYIDNLYDNVNSNIYFRTRTSGTPINALTLTGTGAATFASSVTTGGNIGVGGSNIDSLLTINGTAGSSHSRFREGSTTVGFVGGADGIISGQAGKLAVRGEAGLVLSGQGNAADVVITSSGATFSAGVGISGATAPASGIEFPATQVASASANNLDDYEEGTWTMGVSFGGASVGITVDSFTGTYTKIGRQVSVNGLIQLTNKGTSTGNAVITGLPFTIGSAVSNYGSASLRLTNISFTNQFQAYGAINTSNIVLEQVTSLGVGTTITDTNFANNSAILLSFTYFV